MSLCQSCNTSIMQEKLLGMTLGLTLRAITKKEHQVGCEDGKTTKQNPSTTSNSNKSRYNKVHTNKLKGKVLNNLNAIN